MMRRYMALVEAIDTKVEVRIEAYVGLEQKPGSCDAFPASLCLEIDSSLDQNAATLEIKRLVQQATGYEPARFAWKRVSA